MKRIRGTAAILALLITTACNNSGGKQEGISTQDSLALTNLVRQAYTWHQTAGDRPDFEPALNKPGDTAYAGIDWNKHNALRDAIQKSQFFSKDFIDHYQRIAVYMHDEMRSGKTTWLTNDLSPFGNDANPWCNCQDYPDDYWKRLTIRDIKAAGDSAAFSWTWGDDLRYRVKAKKENGNWKISYLQGFDFSNYEQRP
ncbi:MAG: DUF3828 domain-containing protein [Chitinophagales bacterium]|nr:DUF3828 domain-containing protein [Chitinophagales bacterium]